MGPFLLSFPQAEWIIISERKESRRRLLNFKSIEKIVWQ
jgi:hypothetical protein